MPDFLSLVIPCRDEAASIAACLAGVLGSEGIDAGSFEVIVAEGGSRDGTRAIVAAIAAGDGRVRLVDNPGGNTSAGLNAAIRAARGSILLRIDAHTVIAPDYVKTCVEVLRATGADNVGGPWVARGSGYLSRAIAAASGSRFAAGGSPCRDRRHRGPVEGVYLGCWPRAVLDRVGPFDESLARNQDDEWSLRLAKLGGVAWQDPAIRSWYTCRSSLRQLCRQYFQYGYWKVFVMRKHGRPASFRHLVPGAFVLAVAGLAMACPWSGAARVGLAVMLGLYLAADLLATAIVALRENASLIWVLPAVFPAFHLGYGFGLVAGAWDALVVRRGSGRFVGLTRGEGAR